ncbi:hypothetical protein KUV22_17120 [Microbulbifer agarilyticus]|uniref:hypothetical protein n=2 Tax=Microbulbifer TaxID=48073 RepID=UPI001C96F5FA|nr:hypothetical protein [Microbulbifer agarilyticus]MBY6192146.1 hypothetical protein [Microbulbifer agarilyticus]
MKLNKSLLVLLSVISSSAISSEIYDCKISESYTLGKNAELNKYSYDKFKGKSITFNKVEYSIDVNGEGELMPIQSSSLSANYMKDKSLETMVLSTPEGNDGAFEVSYFYKFKNPAGAFTKGVANLSIYEFYRTSSILSKGRENPTSAPFWFKSNGLLHTGLCSDV